MSMRGNKSARTAVFLLIVFFESIVEARSHYRPATVRLIGAGKIVGIVRSEGHFKRPPPLKVNKNRDVCGNQVSNESLLVGPDGRLQNAVLIIYGARSQKKNGEPPTLILDNKNCAFVPHVQVASLGSEILLLNSDSILHDAHARLGSETLFNVGLPSWRQVKKRLNREGIIKVECDVLHTWQSAYIVVTASSYFAVTDRRGEFVIEGVPANTYEVEVWHEKLGIQSRRVTVAGESTSRLDFIYRLGRKED